MAKLLVQTCERGTFYVFTCPGCGDTHQLFPCVWSFNGDLERPTFQPSILARSGHYCDEHKPGDSCWCTYNAEHADKPAPFACYRCHSFVEEGRIRFLADCSHALAGQTIDLPDCPAEQPK